MKAFAQTVAKSHFSPMPIAPVSSNAGGSINVVWKSMLRNYLTIYSKTGQKPTSALKPIPTPPPMPTLKKAEAWISAKSKVVIPKNLFLTIKSTKALLPFVLPYPTVAGGSVLSTKQTVLTKKPTSNMATKLMATGGITLQTL